MEYILSSVKVLKQNLILLMDVPFSISLHQFSLRGTSTDDKETTSTSISLAETYSPKQGKVKTNSQANSNKKRKSTKQNKGDTG